MATRLRCVDTLERAIGVPPPQIESRALLSAGKSAKFTAHGVRHHANRVCRPALPSPQCPRRIAGDSEPVAVSSRAERLKTVGAAHLLRRSQGGTRGHELPGWQFG